MQSSFCDFGAKEFFNSHEIYQQVVTVVIWLCGRRS
jgi:hypothetical protein